MALPWNRKATGTTFSGAAPEGSDADRGGQEGERAARPARPPKKHVKRFWAKRFEAILGVLGILVALAFWQWLGTSGLVNPLFVSTPTKVFSALVDLVKSGDLWGNLAVSGHEFFVGFALAIVIGIPVGMLMGWYRPVEAFFDPLVNFLYATPRVALLPLFIIWFGLGAQAKIALVFLSAVFPVLISTISGVKELDQSLVTAAHSFGARDLSIFRTIVLPGTVPNIVTGIRLGLGHGLIAVVVGEYFSSSAGIGYLINKAANAYQTDTVFAGVVIIAGAGVALTAIFSRIERRFQSWKPQRGR